MEIDFKEDIKRAVETMRRGGVILYPTDTIWGLGCDASNPEAVKRIFDIKRRADSKSLILLVDGLAMLERHVPEVPDAAYQLIDAAVEPLTIVYDEATGVCPQVKAGDGSVGIRITGERISSELCRRMRAPIVSTSANVSGKPAPAVFSKIEPELINAVDYVMTSGRDNKPGHPSAIIKVGKGNVIKVIR